MDRPVIGITMASLDALDVVAPGHPVSSVVGTRYALSIAAAGGLPWPVPVLEDGTLLEAVYDALDGVVIAGGSDIRPEGYGAAPHPSLDRGDPVRDDVERCLVTWAWRDGKPVLGICRGMQMLAVSRGGRLIQDLASERPGSLRHDWLPPSVHPRDRLRHLVCPVARSRLAHLLGSEPLAVNSIHHQAVEHPGAGLFVSALATDGVVEAVEALDHPFFLGVQWHPEELPRHRAMRTLFEAFVDACAERRGRLRGRAASDLPVAG